MSADYCRLAMRSCLGAAIQRDWHQHDYPHSRDKGNAVRPSEPSLVRESPTLRRPADRVSVKVITAIQRSLHRRSGIVVKDGGALGRARARTIVEAHGGRYGIGMALARDMI